MRAKRKRTQECELSVQLLHGGITPWSRQSAGIQEYSASTPRVKQAAGEGLLLDQRADDKATEGGVCFGIGGWVSVGFLAIVGEFHFPLSTKCWVLQDNRSLVDCVCESRDSTLAFWCNGAFIRTFDSISMSATVAGAHDNLVGRIEFARNRIERVREDCACHS